MRRIVLAGMLICCCCARSGHRRELARLARTRRDRHLHEDHLPTQFGPTENVTMESAAPRGGQFTPIVWA